jgi:biopolymer transport protein ExbB
MISICDAVVRRRLIFCSAAMLAAIACLWCARPSWSQPAAGTEATGEPASAADVSSTDLTRGSSTRATADSGERTVLQSLQDSGYCGVLIFLSSMIAVGFIVEHTLTIRKGTLMPEEVADELAGLVRDGRVNEAIEACRDPANACLLSHVVLAGLERYQGSEFGFAEYRTAAEEAGEDQTGRLYRKTEVLGVIGAVAPMLGLLGTVSGMIKSFNTIAATQGMARPDQLAGGISEALVTTLMGLIVAIPTMVAFSYFRNKIDSLVAEAGKRAEHILMPLGRRH